MNALSTYLIVVLIEAWLSFFFFSLLFYDALIPKTNFKVFKEKIFLKLAIVCLCFYLVWRGIEIIHLFYLLASLLILQILYSLYNRKRFQAWRKFDYCCALSIIGVALFGIIIDLRLFDSGFALAAGFAYVALFLTPIFSLFFAIEFFKRFSFYLKERKLGRALKEHKLSNQILQEKPKEQLSNQETQKEAHKQKNLEEKSNE